VRRGKIEEGIEKIEERAGSETIWSKMSKKEREERR
jgi:hypothetical protein